MNLNWPWEHFKGTFYWGWTQTWFMLLWTVGNELDTDSEEQTLSCGEASGWVGTSVAGKTNTIVVVGKSTPFFETRTIPGSVVCFLAIEATSVVPCIFFPFLQVRRLNKITGCFCWKWHIRGLFLLLLVRWLGLVLLWIWSIRRGFCFLNLASTCEDSVSYSPRHIRNLQGD